MTRDILVTSALPYANGDLHLGHLLETIQTDIWVRFQKAQGNQCVYLCADDAHGTAIMLTAEKEGITPEEQIARVSAAHQADFDGFLIGFDHYHSTHSDDCRRLAELIYTRLRDKGHIDTRDITQLYDPEKGLFLADRYVKGECPKCGAEDQYGDNCEACGATYTPAELRNPRSAISGATPVEKASTHYFFKLADFQQLLSDWLDSDHLQPQIRNKLREWVDAGLQSWDISRDAPYFGFEIPDAPGKYFYVWLDAPIGYMASCAQWCRDNDRNFDDYWAPDSKAEMYHFIGKDIINFHGLFWPAMLDAAGFRKPSSIYVHGFLTVNGKKMSKSRGTFIKAKSYLQHLSPEYLRYYFAAKLSGSVEDIDLNLTDFAQRVNSDLIGKVVNIASRSAKFVHKGNDGKLSDSLHNPELWQRSIDAQASIAAHFERREFGKAMREIMAVADAVNEYFDAQEPWKTFKDEATRADAVAVSSQCLNHFRLLMTWLQPVLPALAEQAAGFLNAELSWQQNDPLLGHSINAFKAMMKRIEQDQLDKLLSADAPKAEAAKADKPKAKKQKAAKSAGPVEELDINDFNKVDLRAAKIFKADTVEGADKLLQLTLDVGALGQRQVFAGIRAHYEPADLPGRMVVLVANLKPRKMRFGLSEGMVLCAGDDGDELRLLDPGADAKPGASVR